MLENRIRSRRRLSLSVKQAQRRACETKADQVRRKTNEPAGLEEQYRSLIVLEQGKDYTTVPSSMIPPAIKQELLETKSELAIVQMALGYNEVYIKQLVDHINSLTD